MSSPQITQPAGYVTPVAVGFSSSSGVLNLVTSGAPLPVATQRAGTAPSPLAGSTSASTAAGPFVPLLDTPIHVQLSGTWTGSVQLQRSIDGGATRQAVTLGGGSWARFTGNANEAVWQEGEAAATFYLAIDLTAGTLSYRVSQ